LPVHAFPPVRHDVFSATHVFAPPSPPPHVPEQHSASVVHAFVSDTHCVVLHLPPVHETVQHSVALAQLAP